MCQVQLLVIVFPVSILVFPLVVFPPTVDNIILVFPLVVSPPTVDNTTLHQAIYHYSTSVPLGSIPPYSRQYPTTPGYISLLTVFLSSQLRGEGEKILGEPSLHRIILFYHWGKEEFNPPHICKYTEACMNGSSIILL